MTANWLRVADSYLAEGVERFPDDERLQRQYASLAGLRLNADQMQSRLVNWQRHGTPALDLVAMAIGLYALDGRGVAPSETWLRAAVEADATDLESRLGLARCLLATGRYQQCVVLLEPVGDSDRARSLLVIAHVTMNDLSTAADVMPDAEPAEDQADYWYARGLLALERRELEDAEESLGRAVSLRPLSPSYRSRYCDVLRRLDETERHDEQVRQLELVTRILQKTLLFGTTNDLSPLAELSPLCEAVGAKEAASLVAAAVRPREPS
jgi:tetratricopeptide (TPR) repeat protein